jgi:hypothetical protein
MRFPLRTDRVGISVPGGSLRLSDSEIGFDLGKAPFHHRDRMLHSMVHHALAHHHIL